MIELYAKLTRSVEEILSLLNAPITSNSSVSQDPIDSTEAIIYYGGVIQRTTIIESPNGYGLTYTCFNLKRMSTPHNYSFNQLFNNISEILACGDRKQVTEIDYRRPTRVVNRKLVHDTVQIQNDADVQQMINRWKSTQLLNPSVQRED